jgi:hypothetical protein
MSISSCVASTLHTANTAVPAKDMPNPIFTMSKEVPSRDTRFGMSTSTSLAKAAAELQKAFLVRWSFLGFPDIIPR